MKQLVVYALLLCNLVFCKERTSSEPYLTGDTLRMIADHIHDEEYDIADIQKIEKGDIIFVGMTDRKKMQDFFLHVHPQIKVPYILITHNGDESSPGEYERYVNDQTIYRWFGQNPSIQNHPKFEPLPIGLENAHWGRRYPTLISRLQRMGRAGKKKLLLGNFSVGTNYKVRKPIYDYFQTVPYCYMPKRMGLQRYLWVVRGCQFVVSPPGNGLDCHRTWEALLLGSYPVVLHSPLDPIYEGLPVLIVDDYKKVTPEFLEKTAREFKKTSWKQEKLYFDYWKRRILQAKNRCKQETL